MNIKLRVWDGEKMVYKVGIDPSGIAYSIPDYAEDSDQYNYYPECPVMMDTGLKDKNGNKIYGGDILKIHEGEDWNWIKDVEYFFGGFYLSDENSLGAVHSFSEVIGNIYENPELLQS